MEIKIVGFQKAKATVAEFDDKPMDRRLRKGVVIALKPEKARLRAAAPKGATGKLARSMSVRQGKKGISAVAGPKDWKRHLVIDPVKAHSLGGQGSHSEFSVFGDGQVRRNADIWHGGTPGNPFVDRVQQQDERAIQERVEQELFAVLNR